MDSASDISTCKRLLGELDEAEKVDKPGLLNKLAIIYGHLPTEVAPRLQKDYDHCTTQSEQILSELFDKVDISDKNLLNSLLKLLLAYGNFRTAQIAYHIETYRDEIEADLRFTPIIAKTRWYDLTPLLPAPAGTIDWKSLLIHSSVRDPDQLSLAQTSNKLLVQKLHFYAIILRIDRFRGQLDTIKKNGLRVAEKLAETIFDSANDDEDVVDLDSFQFNLMTNFIEEDQLAALIEAIIRARLKSNLSPELEASQESSSRKLTKLISECLVDRPNLQETFVIKSIEHLKCNLVRRKRRHSVEAQDEDVAFTLESILGDISTNVVDPVELIVKSGDLKLSSKSIQKKYLEQWTQFLQEVFEKKTLTPPSSVMLTTTFSVLLICISDSVSDDLNTELSLLLAKTVDSTSQKRLDKFFKFCGPRFLSEITKQLAETTQLLEHFETPVMRFYRSYFFRYMRHSTIRKNQKDVENFSQFINFICDKAISKNKSHILEYVFLCELSDYLDDLGSRTSNKLTQSYVDYGKVISKKLYKFIKHRPFNQLEVDSDDMIIDGPSNGDSEEHHKPAISEEVQTIVIDALVCIIKIAVNRQEQQMLDTYGELMLKLYNLMCSRFEELLVNIRLGHKCEHKAVDPHLHRLIDLYTAHRAVIEPYLCYDLNKRICKLLDTTNPNNCKEEQGDVEVAKEKKVGTYEVLKTKIDSIAEKDLLVFQSIINGQFASVIDQTIGQVSKVGREEVCYKHYSNHMSTASDVLTILFHNCDLETYNSALDSVVKQFEMCDALDHPRVLSLFYILESLIPKQLDKDSGKSDSFSKAFPTIGCCLIRIAKSVELGPSVISFSNPGTHKSSGSMQCCTYSHCIRLYALIFDRCSPDCTNSLITDAMQICISANLTKYAKYSTKLHRYFIQLASSIARLLKSVHIGKRKDVERVMPVFLSVFSLLIRCIILASDREKLDELPKMNGHSAETNGLTKDDEDLSIEEQCKVYEKQLEYLAHDVGRLMNKLCSFETNMVDYAPHLISTYIRDTQRASCPGFVKKHLDEGIFRIFNLVDSYQKERQERVVESGVQRKTTAAKASGSLFEMVHARLDQASREIFKDMHDEYNRFHSLILDKRLLS